MTGKDAQSVDFQSTDYEYRIAVPLDASEIGAANGSKVSDKGHAMTNGIGHKHPKRKSTNSKESSGKTPKKSVGGKGTAKGR